MSLTPVSQVAPPSTATVLHCPRCGYNLRGTSEPRCPECGLQFAWEELSQWAEVPWLYETARGRLPLRAWAGTLRRSLRPARFWSRIPLTLPPVPARLVQYAGLTVLLVVLLTAVAPDATYELRRAGRALLWSDRPWTIIGRHLRGTLSLWVTDPLFCLPPKPVLLAPIGYVLATGCGLLICSRSLGRLRIKPVHILRMVAYSSGVMLLWPVGVVIGTCVTPALARSFAGSAALLCWGMFMLMLAHAFVLQQAMSHYARYQQTRSIVWASQVIAALASLNILIAGMLYF